LLAMILFFFSCIDVRRTAITFHFLTSGLYVSR
jgi:hypothetical protein